VVVFEGPQITDRSSLDRSLGLTYVFKIANFFEIHSFESFYNVKMKNIFSKKYAQCLISLVVYTVCKIGFGFGWFDDKKHTIIE
jgi:hypothetical protein